MLRKRFKESHAQGTCPICGDKMWSDEWVVEVEGVGYVHADHCTDESLEALQDFADEFWSTHDSEPFMTYYKNQQLYNKRKPKCVLKSGLRESKKLTEATNEKISMDDVSIRSFNIGNKATCRCYGETLVGEITEIWFDSKYCVCMIHAPRKYIVALFTHKDRDLKDCKFITSECFNGIEFPDAKDLFEDFSRFPQDYA